MSKTQDVKIKQMINFIEGEAQEKANEIKVQANEEFAIEKQNLVEVAKKKIREEYEKKEKAVDVEKKMYIYCTIHCQSDMLKHVMLTHCFFYNSAHSNKIKEARLAILKMKDEIMKEMRKRALEKVRQITENKELYSKLLKDLILQCLIRLNEKEANVYCREQDYKLVVNQIKLAEKEYTEKTGLTCKVTVQEKNYLPSDSIGGVMVCSFEDRIKVINTLEQRMALVYEQQLPTIRQILFPKESSTQV